MVSRLSRRTRAQRGSASAEVKETAGSLVRFVASVAVLAWIIRSFILQPFYIPSESMLPSLYVGDYLVVAKWPYGYSRYSFPFAIPRYSGRLIAHLPRRGDVIVFRHPAEEADLIKRVIGLPGDLIEVRGGVVILNGQAVRRQPLAEARIPVSPNSPCRVVASAGAGVATIGGRPTCLYQAFLETLPSGPSYEVLAQPGRGLADDFAPTRVPRDHLFVMGDNRDDSLDSRFSTVEGGVGMLPAANVIGRAQLTFWSTDGSASYAKPWTWFTALRSERLGNVYTGRAR